ncbi:MAG: hypothetical protein P8N09_08400 [Planctomycetota bacterium]|jgi:hypothetical protein|nr:hypothetical protein [Planctomycetota bacterium]
MRTVLRTVGSWLDELGSLGASLVLVLVLVDIMFPGASGIVANIGDLLDGLTVEGRYSLVAIFIFLLVHHRWRTTRLLPRASDSERSGD